MTHPSIQGLREAARESRKGHWPRDRDRADVVDACECGWEGRHFFAVHLEELRETAQAAYLTEHGVGWFGEGLVRAVDVSDVCLNPTSKHTRRCGRPSYHPGGHYSPPTDVELVCLVPVPQDGE